MARCKFTSACRPDSAYRTIVDINTELMITSSCIDKCDTADTTEFSIYRFAKLDSNDLAEQWILVSDIENYTHGKPVFWLFL